MTDVLDGVAEAVGVVVRGVDAPLVAGSVVNGVLDPVGHGVLLALFEGDLHPQGGLALIELSVLHVFEELEAKNEFKTFSFFQTKLQLSSGLIKNRNDCRGKEMRKKNGQPTRLEPFWSASTNAI